MTRGASRVARVILHPRYGLTTSRTNQTSCAVSGEAAYAIGMRKTQVMRHVLLPQAVKIMLPAIISQCVVALKDTSLGFAITAPGLTAIQRPIYQEFGNQVQVALVVATLYVACNLVLSVLATWLQKRLVGSRKPLEVGMVGEAKT